MGWRMLLAKPDASLNLRALAQTKWDFSAGRAWPGSLSPAATSGGMQQSQAVLIQGFKQALNTKSAKLGLKQER